jgi:hypothetical protein
MPCREAGRRRVSQQGQYTRPAGGRASGGQGSAQWWKRVIEMARPMVVCKGCRVEWLGGAAWLAGLSKVPRRRGGNISADWPTNQDIRGFFWIDKAKWRRDNAMM